MLSEQNLPPDIKSCSFDLLIKLKIPVKDIVEYCLCPT